MIDVVGGFSRQMPRDKALHSEQTSQHAKFREKRTVSAGVLASMMTPLDDRPPSGKVQLMYSVNKADSARLDEKRRYAAPAHSS